VVDQEARRKIYSQKKEGVVRSAKKKNETPPLGGEPAEESKKKADFIKRATSLLGGKGRA